MPLIFQLHLYLKQAALRVVVDAYFAKAPFINPLLRKGIHVVGRLRGTVSVGMIPPLSNALTPNGAASGSRPGY